jgi:hypothetical protein
MSTTWSRFGSRPWVRHGLLDLAFVPFGFWLSWSLLAVHGMPMTHDGFGLAFVESYRRTYLAGDLFPLWTAFAEKGHGSELPILYHRLHAQIFGALAVALGSLRALKLSVPVLLTVGAAGMRRLCLFFGARGWLAWIAGVLLIASNYAVADWFVRGAVAELTAFMLVPWCLRHAMQVFRDRWGPVRLAASMSLLFFAHMTTFYAFGLIATGVMAGSLFRMRALGWPRVRKALEQGALFVVLLACAVGPYAAAVKYTLDFSGINSLGMRSDDGAYFQWPAYFRDPNLSWTRAIVEGQMSVEIGRWTLLCLAVALVVVPAARRAVRERLWGLALVAVFIVALQRRPMAFLFDMIPGVSKLQFPSRLLVFVVPIVVLCTAVAVEAALRSTDPIARALGHAMPVIAAAGQVNLAIAIQRSIWGTEIHRDEIDEAIENTSDVTTGKMSQYSSWDVFLPRKHGNAPASPFLQTSEGCTVSSPRLTQGMNASLIVDNAQCNSVSFTVHGEHCTINLSLYETPLLRFDLSRPGGVRSKPDDTIALDVPADGTVVRIRERSVLDLAGKWLVQKVTRLP